MKKILNLLLLLLCIFALAGCDQLAENGEPVSNSEDMSEARGNEQDNTNSEEIADTSFLQEDINAFETYFADSLSIDKPTISENRIMFFGTSNDWRVYQAVYDNQFAADAECSETLGEYTFHHYCIYQPYSIAIYAIKDDEIYTLTQAYEKELIDIEQVYGFMPDRIKLGIAS